MGSAKDYGAVWVVSEHQSQQQSQRHNQTCAFDTESIRRGFVESAKEFVRVVDLLAKQDLDWNSPVGDSAWSLRTVVGHCSRALRTPVTYLERGKGLEPTLSHPFDYFGVLSSDYSVLTAILERAKKAAEDLGADPAECVRQLAVEVIDAVAEAPDQAPVSTAAGVMTLCSYLPSRVMVLTIDTGALANTFGTDLRVGEDAARIAFLMSVGVVAEAPANVDVLKLGVPSLSPS